MQLSGLPRGSQRWKSDCETWHQGVTLPSVEETNNRSFFAVYNSIQNDMREAQETGEIEATIPLVVTSEFLLFTVMGLCISCINDPKLRKQAPLDRRIAMIIGFMKTGDAAALEVGDPNNEY